MTHNVIAVDFDGTLFDNATAEPMPHAVAAMLALKASGVRIIVHTCRARPDEVQRGKIWRNSEEFVHGWLHAHGIPFDDVTALKPIADWYIDDRALRFDNNWMEIAAEVLS